jgi:phospholipase/lecithinase/hemolysin
MQRPRERNAFEIWDDRRDDGRSLMLKKTWIVLALLACASAWANDRGHDRAPFDRVVVFGTSLSDPGNAFALTGAASNPPDWDVDAFLIPAAPYAKGGHHFSNGPTWIEQLGRSAGLARYVRAAFRDEGRSKAANYAVGGARARNDGASVHLSAQVQRFLDDSGGAAPDDALYVIEMGGNDIRGALAAGGGTAGAAILSAALESISDNIVQLYVRGARRFLVWNAPDLGRTPAVIALDRLSPGAALGAGLLTQAFNAHLDQILAQLAAALPGARFDRLDVYAKLNTVVMHPRLFGLRDVDSACIMPNDPPFSCRHPERFLFWDGIHPTKAAHGILAEEAARVLGAD